MPETDRNLMLPIHEQISEALRSRIRSGELPVGSRLPAEATLMAEFGVARGTVRRALRTLAEQGIVQTLQGKGTYVRSGRPEPSIAQTLVGLSEALSYSEKSLTTTVLRQEVVPASSYPEFPAGGRSEGDRAGGSPDGRSRADASPDRNDGASPDGPAHVDAAEQFLALDRVRYLDGVPVARLKNWVRLSLAPGIETTDFTTTALFTALESTAPTRVASGRRTFEAVLAEGDVAESLGISEVVPLLFLKQITYLDDGQVVECSDVWMDSQHITVAMNLIR